MHLLRGVVLSWLMVTCLFAQDLGFGPFRTPANTLGRKRPVRARLVLSHEMAKPGETVMAGVELTMESGWHTYWQNPGVGEETKVLWAASEGITPGVIQWPFPEKYTTGEEVKLTSYIYHDRAVLLMPLKVADNAPAGLRELSALVRWLQCEKICVPGSNMVSAMLTIGNESKLTDETNFFAQAEKRLPLKQVPGTVSAKWDQPPTVTNRAFVIEWATTATEPDFFPFTNALAKVTGPTAVASNGSNVVLRKTAVREGADWPKEIAGLLVRKENGSLVGYETTLQLTDANFPSAASASNGGETKSIFGWLVYAFLGGLILNIMPCVLPVIALKILGFVSQSREHPGRVRTLGLLYTLGVIVSFLVLAGIVIGVKAAGQKAGWGMQFSNPQFIVVLTVIVTLVALNLFGVFEVTLSGRTVSAAGDVASRHGNAGAFMNGVLATLLATPCTAPFLGAALGFAFVQPAPVIVLFFVTVALGLALPYLLLSWNPRWLKFLPKPGAWMERFKIAMGFPMLATALWLLNLTTTFYGERSWWLGVFLVFVGAVAWIFGTFFQRGGSRRGLALGVASVLAVAGYAWALDSNLRWRSPDTNTGSGPRLANAPEGYPWQPWSAEAVAKARAEGRPVVVDFTAKWCATCNASVKPAFETKRVIEKLQALKAAALVGDWTLYAPDITAELEHFGRSGVPMVLVYPADATKPPLVLPEPLPFPASYSPTVLKALEEVMK